MKARRPLPPAHLNLALAHDLVHDLVVVLVDLALVVARLVAQDPEALGALQLDLKLLQRDRTHAGEEEEEEEEGWMDGWSTMGPSLP